MTPSAPLTPDMWRRVNDLFHRALAEPSEGRERFLDAACAGDAVLRAEVASLLQAHGQADDFIERPASSPAELFGLAVAPAHLAIGQVIGQYRIERVLGEGGMGVVYLAEDQRLGRTVALKAVAPRFTGDPARRERLRREARTAAALTHPGIATVYALEEFDDQIFIAGEYVPGETLRDELGRGPLGVARTVETALSIARALAAAHDRGIIHRDLKPENVIRTPGGDLKILDFGLAQMRDLPPGAARLTDNGTFLGTPAYMSPEQIRGEPVQARSDLFALGILMYELVSGVHPFAGSDPASTIARILETEPARLSAVHAGDGASLALLGQLEGLVRTCLKKSPGARFGSAHELANLLEQMRQGKGALPGVHATPSVRVDAEAGAVWWWQFHQAAASIAYLLLFIPLWFAREWIGQLSGLLVFVAGLIAGVAAVILRLHQWFAARSYPSAWRRQRRQSAPWIRLADSLFVAALVAGGAALLTSHASMGVVLIVAAVAVLLSFTIIEPATARAAFGDPS